MRTARRSARAALPSIVAIAVAAPLLVAGAAAANPLDLARFGGLEAGPTIGGAYALYWNPAGIARPGWDLAVGVEVIARQASYDRDAVLNAVPADEVAANAGLATVGSTGAIPALAARWGLGLGGVDIGLGAGLFVTTGGAASWDKNLRAPTGDAGAIDGPQRWSSITARLLVGDIDLGIALRHRRSGLSFGVTPVLRIADFSTVRARNIDGTEQLFDSQGNLKEGRAYFHGQGYGLSCILGLRWDPTPRTLVAATYQIGGQLDLTGDLRVVFGTQAPGTERAALTLPLADTLRVGAAVEVVRGLTLRPMIQWARWSVLDAHVFRSAADGSVLQQIPRQSNDGFAAKIAVDLRLGDRVRLTAAFGGEKGPTPSRTMDPGFGEGDSVEGGVGATVAIGHFVDVKASLLFQYFLPWTVIDSIEQPSTNGTYRDQREMLILDVEMHGWRDRLR